MKRVTLGIGNQKLSRLHAAAHMLVCLRINAVVADSAARLTTGLPGSALAGRVSHPLDDFSEFRRLPHIVSFRTSRAWSLPRSFQRGVQSFAGPPSSAGYFASSVNAFTSKRASMPFVETSSTP